jgi:hypothetical protein
MEHRQGASLWHPANEMLDLLGHFRRPMCRRLAGLKLRGATEASALRAGVAAVNGIGSLVAIFCKSSG